MVDVQRATKALDAAVAKLDAAGAEVNAYRDASLVSVIGREAFVAGLEHRTRIEDEARRELHDLQRLHGDPAGEQRRYELLATMDTLGPSEHRALLAAEIDAVICRKAPSSGKGTLPSERLRILWRGEAPADLPSRNQPQMRRFLFDDE